MNHDISPAPRQEIAALLEAGLAHHRAGRLGDAQAFYARILELQHDQPAALHYFGVLALNQGDPEHAAQLMDRALAQAPGDAELLANRGVVAVRLGDHAAAAALQRKAIEIAPDFANAHNNLGNALMELGDLACAEQHYRRARSLDPHSAHFAFNLGRALEKAGRAPEAVAQYQDACALDSDDTQTLMHLGKLQRAATQHAQAAACFERIVQLEPENAIAHFELGYVYDAMHRYEEAIPHYRRAAALKPDAAGAVNNLAFALTALARYDEAEGNYRRALEMSPGLPEPQFQLGMLMLRRGEYDGGWPLFEHRKTTTTGKPNYRKLPCAEWQGEPLAGKRILIAREQGVGDQIQFVRYAGLLAKMGAQVDAWVAPELASLVATVPGVARVLDAAPGDEAISERYDYWCDVMSLPLKFPGRPIHAPVPYMHADATQAAAWRARVDALAGIASRRIGLVWAGNPQHLFDTFRSVPLTALLPLAALEGNAWFAIQKGPGAAQIADIAGRWTLHAVGDDLHDFASTAALIESLDLVITVDTSVAHLAGALGKPVWVLLAAQPDWRWGMGRVDSVWYPSARLFRQSTLGAWGSVVAGLQAAFAAEQAAAAASG
ncbi:Photosystem I assembly protein Ycf3 [Paraburkholderia caffeinitolerans]|uniref:Photosystem I assembly protein Ycf3 n=1 Tax=Paraburkholderia caffeinitolerans TaxID=1723730 RepID=A0A6J5F918_9BURK|nr:MULTISPECIES: tetratricopeptide repeat protein [Paraburkholderia]CAB3775506.1 Photosystem I assembly protein Ycf3 [Paraburkholderia caffeinitolerans]